MSSSYLDTSALAKWYLPEAGSEQFTRWLQEQDEAFVSSLTRVELRSLLARRQRMGYLDAVQAQEVFATFQQDCRMGHLLHCPVKDEHFLDAELLLESLPRVPLRTLDALQLSVAQDLAVEYLATADRVMAEAARQMNIGVCWFGPAGEEGSP